MTRISYVAAPGIWLAGWVIMRLGGGRGPNAGWMVAHSLWLIAFMFFGVAIVGLTRRLPPPGVWRQVGMGAAGVGLVGVAAMLGQTIVDLWAAWGAVDRAQMSARSSEITDHPLWGLLLFGVGPALLYAGIFGVLVALAAARRVPSWVPWLSAVSIAATLAGRGIDGFRFLEGVGALALLVALVAAGRVGWSTRPRPRLPAPVTSR